jgi:hypothetical protein
MNTPEPQLRFRLLECETCGARSWITDTEPAPAPNMHRWWERYTFHATSNGPGLAPTQTRGLPA